MRFRFDHFFKKLLRKLLSDLGQVEAEVEVAVDAQRIDLLFTPSEAAAPRLAELGLLGRIVASSCILEAFHAPPSLEQIHACARKLLDWRHLQILRADRQARRARRARQRSEDGPHERPASKKETLPPQVPVLWILSSGHPREAMDAFAFTPLEGWPPGVYAVPQAEIPMRFVVLGELPRTRDTLVLRTFGRGSTVAHAAREIDALPADAWERRLLVPYLLSLRRKLVKVHAEGPRTNEEKELLMDGQKVMDALDAFKHKAWKQGRAAGLEQGRAAGLEQGRAAGLEQGHAAGLEQGLGPLVHQFTRRLGRPLDESERATICRRLDKLGADRLGDVVLDLDADRLAAWLRNPRAR